MRFDRRSRRRAPLIALAALALLLGGCGRSEERALGQEALYDRLMPLKAYPAARQAIQKAIDIKQDEPRLWLKLARANAALGNSAGAAAAYQRALDLAPDTIEALESLSVLAIRGGEIEAAKRYVQPLLLLAPNDLNGMLVSGAIATEEKRFGDARRLADQIISAAPDRAEGYILQARIADLSGRRAEAAKILDAQVARDPANADVLAQLLQLHRRTGNRQGVQDVAVRLAKIFPDDPVIVVESARAYRARGRDDLVRSTLADLRRRLPRASGVTRAIARFWQENYPAEVARREIAALAEGSSSEGRAVLAGILLDLGDPTAALPLVRAVENQPVQTANVEAQTTYTRILLAAGQPAQARARADAILAFDESNTAALMLRARLRLAQRDGEGALNDAQLAVSTDAGSEEAQLLVGRAYAMLDRPALADQAFGGALRHFPDSVSALNANAQWLIAQKRQVEAVRIAQHFRRRNPGATGQRAFDAVCTAAGRAACATGTSGSTDPV